MDQYFKVGWSMGFQIIRLDQVTFDTMGFFRYL